MEEENLNYDKTIFCCMHKLLTAEIYCLKCRDYFCRNCEEFHQSHRE